MWKFDACNHLKKQNSLLNVFSSFISFGVCGTEPLSPRHRFVGASGRYDEFLSKRGQYQNLFSFPEDNKYKI